jgi:hypothetical protein
VAFGDPEVSTRRASKVQATRHREIRGPVIASVVKLDAGDAGFLYFFIDLQRHTRLWKHDLHRRTWMPASEKSINSGHVREAIVQPPKI